MPVTRLTRRDGRRIIEDDWYDGTIPEGAHIDETAYVGSSQCFIRYRSELAVGTSIGRGASLCDATSLDIGRRGIVRLAEFSLVTAARIICDLEVSIGPYALVSWDVVIMDSYRTALSPEQRARAAVGAVVPWIMPRPVRLAAKSWVGFGACILPGVTVGEGSIVAARSVVAEDVPPYVVVAGNPARFVRALDKDESVRLRQP